MQGKQVITIEKLFGGWTPSLNSTILGSPVEASPRTMFEIGQEYSSSDKINPLIPGYEGHIAPGPFPTQLTDTGGLMNGVAMNGTVDSAGNAYTLINGQVSGARVIWFPVAGTNIPAANIQTITVSGVHSGHTSITAINGDILNFPYQSGTPPTNTTDEYLYYSWEDGTDGDVGRKVKSTGVFLDNYLTALQTQTNGTALITGVPHPLLVAKNNVLYVGNGRYLASHDPSTNTSGTIGIVDYMGFDVKFGWIIQALTTYQNYIAIFAYKNTVQSSTRAKGETKMFLWDGFSPSWNFEYDIKDNYVACAINDGDNLYCITFGRNNTIKLKQFSGSGFDTVVEQSKQITATPKLGGIDIWLNSVAWGGDTVFVYGSPNEKYPKGLHQIGGNGDGMIKNLYSNFLYASSTNAIYRMDLTKYTFQSNPTWVSNLCVLPTNSTITAVKVYFSKFDTGAAIGISMFNDYVSPSVGGTTDLLSTWNGPKGNLGEAKISQADFGSVSYVPMNISIQNVNSFYLYILFRHASSSSAAIIRKIEIEYQVDDNNI